MTCFITGDLHGSLDAEKLEPQNFWQGLDLTKDDYLLIAGDFGLVLDGSDDERIERKHLAESPWTTLFIDGNHENFDMLDEYPIQTWHGGKVHRISRSILHLMRGQVFDICGKSVFTMGGAESIDADWRVPGFTWWPQELPSHGEMVAAEDTLDACGWKVDIIVTHDCSTRMLQRIYGSGAKPDAFNDWLDMLEDRLDFGIWYFGHHHQDIEIDDKHIMLYNSIVEMT